MGSEMCIRDRRTSGDATASSLISWTLFPYGRIASLVKQEQLRTPLPLRAQLKAASGAFSPMSDGDTARETVGPNSHRDPEAWCSERGHYRPERPRPGVPDGDITGQNGRGLVFPEGDITGPSGRGLVFPDGDITCLLYTSPSPRDLSTSRMPSSA